MVMASREEERWAKASSMACEAIDECRIQLMFKFRFLDLALWKMPLVPLEVQGRYPLATDARNVYLDPYSVLARFGDSFEEAVRDYLHLVLHCIFRHPFDENHEKHPAWWLACDVMAESVALEICDTRFPSPDDLERKAAVSELRARLGTLTPGKLYAHFDKAMGAPHGTVYAGLSADRIVELQALFERDNHEAWPSYAKGESRQEPGEAQEVSEKREDGKDAEGDRSGMIEPTSPDEPPAQPDTAPDDASSSDEGDETASSSDDASEESPDAGDGAPECFVVQRQQII